jgi:hypothetical protein
MCGVKCLKTENIFRPLCDNLKSRKAHNFIEKNGKAKSKRIEKFALYALKIRSNSKHFL